jgi:type IV secretory pathway VirB9-like protein
MNKFIIAVLFLSIFSHGYETKRIKAIAFNKGKVEPIYIAAGLSTMVTFNCDINEMIAGNEQQVTLKGSLTNKKQMIITLAQDASQPTNVFVRCGQKTDPFIFDIVPNKQKHQDYLKINIAYGEPEEEKQNLAALTKAIKRKKPVLIEVSKPEIKRAISPDEKLKIKGRSIEVEPPRKNIQELLDKQESGK